MARSAASGPIRRADEPGRMAQAGSSGMARRVDLDPTLPAIEMPGRILNELYAHARESETRECCGLLIGVGGDPYRRAIRCHNEMDQRHRDDPQRYPRDARTAYYMSPSDLEAVRREVDRSGERVSAIYHSHVGPDAVPYLSEEDLAFAEHAFFPFPDAEQVVIAVSGRHKIEVGLFRRTAARGSSFHGRRVRSQDLVRAGVEVEP